MPVTELLVYPDPTTQESACQSWLNKVTHLLGGFRKYPLVLRHQSRLQRDGYQADVEIRRWSEEAFLRLEQPSRGEQELLLLQRNGTLWCARLQRRRWIRKTPEEQIYDDIFEVAPQLPIREEHLNRVVQELVEQRGALFWQNWETLGDEQKSLLVSVPHEWPVLQEALEQSQARAQEALPLLLSELAHPSNRRALLEAGSAESYAPPAQALPWLFLQVEWNLSPGLLGLVGASLQANRERGWQLRNHPNPVVRRRLAQMLPTNLPWLDWLIHEGDDSVRQTLRLRIERESSPSQLVEHLLRTQDEAEKSALGWLLTSWSRPWDSLADQRAMWSAVEKGLTPVQGKKLRRRLNRVGPRRG